MMVICYLVTDKIHLKFARQIQLINSLKFNISELYSLSLQS